MSGGARGRLRRAAAVALAALAFGLALWTLARFAPAWLHGTRPLAPGELARVGGGLLAFAAVTFVAALLGGSRGLIALWLSAAVVWLAASVFLAAFADRPWDVPPASSLLLAGLELPVAFVTWGLLAGPLLVATALWQWREGIRMWRGFWLLAAAWCVLFLGAAVAVVPTWAGPDPVSPTLYALLALVLTLPLPLALSWAAVRVLRAEW